VQSELSSSAAGSGTSICTIISPVLGIPQPSVMAKSVDGGLNSPSTANSADGEVMLDIEVARGPWRREPSRSCISLQIPTKVFSMPSTTAIHDSVNKPSVISISWGSAESQWTVQSMNSFNEAFRSAAALGITIVSPRAIPVPATSVLDGKVHVDFPASSPFVLACGGTRLVAKGNTVAA